jgi:ketosteroid isomerase-like protein
VAKLDVASVQQVLDATEAGDYGPVFESFAENIVVENGPGAGPWRHAEGRDEFANVLLEFSAYFNGTFRQRGRCIYADDRVVTSLIEESGSTPAGDAFENLAVYVTRMGADDKADRLWTVDLDRGVPRVLGSQSGCIRSHGSPPERQAARQPRTHQP